MVRVGGCNSLLELDDLLNGLLGHFDNLRVDLDVFSLCKFFCEFSSFHGSFVQGLSLQLLHVDLFFFLVTELVRSLLLQQLSHLLHSIMRGLTNVVLALHVVSEDPGEALTHIHHLLIGHCLTAVRLHIKRLYALVLQEAELQLAHLLVATVHLLDGNLFQADILQSFLQPLACAQLLVVFGLLPAFAHKCGSLCDHAGRTLLVDLDVAGPGISTNLLACNSSGQRQSD